MARHCSNFAGFLYTSAKQIDPFPVAACRCSKFPALMALHCSNFAGALYTSAKQIDPFPVAARRCSKLPAFHLLFPLLLHLLFPLLFAVAACLAVAPCRCSKLHVLMARHCSNFAGALYYGAATSLNQIGNFPVVACR